MELTEELTEETNRLLVPSNGERCPEVKKESRPVKLIKKTYGSDS